MATTPKEMTTENGSHTEDTNTISKEYRWKNLGSHLMPWMHWWLANRRSVDTANADKGDVTRDDSQRRFLAQHSVAMLEQCCNLSKQCCNTVLRLKSSLRIVSCNVTLTQWIGHLRIVSSLCLKARLRAKPLMMIIHSHSICCTHKAVQTSDVSVFYSHHLKLH